MRSVDLVIRARNVSKRYGQAFAVAGLDLDLHPATIFGVVGPSGAGKTTTVRLLTGSEAPSSGTVEVLGRAPAAFTPGDRARLGYLPQLPVLYPHLSLQENLAFVAAIYGLGPRTRRVRIAAALELVELTADRRKLLQQASGGMQRRLALAAALLHDPELLFLDEPTAGIDPVLRRKFWEHFADLRDEGRSLFVTTQYVGEAAHCDVVALLAHGRVLAVDTPERLRRRAFGGDLLDVVASEPVEDRLLQAIGALTGVRRAERGPDPRTLRLVVEDADEAVRRLRRRFADHARSLDAVHPHSPPFDDVFVALLAGEDGDA